ncbi:MAG: sodium-dependent transporter [Pseudomonadales bacterium]|nr:sodium-dependent transporter [Pseudomonadales bacterium]
MAAGGDVSRHGMWSSRWLFVMAAAGSAVGLGNIWKFPYLTGENGGAAFVLVYLVSIMLVGIPIMIAEVLLGREGRNSPITTMRELIQAHHRQSFWVLIGWMGVLAGFLILSYYSVIAGWALYYMWEMATGAMAGTSTAMANQTFNDFMANPWLMLLCHTLFMVATVAIVRKGVVKGLETAIRIFMPLLFVLLMVLLGYSVFSGAFGQGFSFMFDFKWEDVTAGTWLLAMGQSFFTLSLGMGAMMAYGAYVPRETSIASTVFTIAGLDTLVSLAAGLAIFPIVFANGLEPGQGPGLMFVTLPLAFGQMPLGSIFGLLFFMLIGFAAITSAISLTEPVLAYLVEEYNAKRARVAISIGVICWLLGIGTVLSFNAWADVKVDGTHTIFEFVDYITQNIMLPLGGLLIALFCAWQLPRKIVADQLGITSGGVWAVWKLLIGIVAPLGVLAVFLVTFFPCLQTLSCSG